MKRSQGVPLRKKMAWGMGGMADNFMLNGLNTLAMPVYNLGYGVNAVWLGYAMAIPRLLDAITDPVMGNISDNTRSRFGRRRPYIFWGTLACALLFPLLWLPPFDAEGGKALYFMAVYCVYTLAYTIFVVPYTALGLELSSDGDERTRVIAWRMYLGLIGGLSMPWLYKLCLLPAFGGAEAKGILYVGPIVGALILVSGVIPAFFSKEAHAVHQEKIRLRDALVFSARNRAFRILLAGYLIILCALMIPGALGLYINIFYVCAGDKNAAATIMGWSGTLMTVAAFFGVFFGAVISARFGKLPTMLFSLLLAAAAAASLWWTMSPLLPYLQLISFFALGLSLQCCWLMAASLVADVCDEDELVTGLRREGLYSAVMGFSQKAAFALVSVLGGYALALSGFEEGSVPEPDVLFRMRLFFVVIQAAGLFAAFYLFLRFPISKKRAAEVRALLDLRSGQNPSS